MKAGDLIRVTKEYGKYWYMNTDISGMIGTILRINKHACEILLSDGVICTMHSNPDAWLEVINDTA